MKYKKLKEKIKIYQEGRTDFLYGIEGLSIYDKINIGKGMYIIVGGQSGSGKTSFVDTAFVINPFLSYLHTKLPVWIYNAMERDTETKIAKWTCNIMLREHAVLMDVPTLLNFPTAKRKLSKEDFRIIDAVEETMYKLEQQVIITSGTSTAEQIRDRKYSVAYQRGKLVTADDKYFYVNGEKGGELSEVETRNGISRRYYEGRAGKVYQDEALYVADDPDEVVFTIDDHIGKIEGPEGANSKKVIDRHASYQGFFRDVCRYTPIDISQFNRDSQGTQRNIRLELDIQEKDFKNSGTPYENSDLALGLINPHKLGHKRYRRISVEDMVTESGENRLRVLKIVKSSYGIDDLQIPLMFLGENGHFMDFPEEPSAYDYDNLKTYKI